MNTDIKSNPGQTPENTNKAEEYISPADIVDTAFEHRNDPFARRDSIQRTMPGLSKLLELNNTLVETPDKSREVREVWEQPNKRKRTDLIPEQRTMKKADKIGTVIKTY